MPSGITHTYRHSYIGLHVHTYTNSFSETEPLKHWSLVSLIFTCNECIMHVSRWQSFCFFVYVPSWYKCMVQDECPVPAAYVFCFWRKYLMYCMIWGSHGDRYDNWTERGTSRWRHFSPNGRWLKWACCCFCTVGKCVSQRVFCRRGTRFIPKYS
jgi:hypothetical protein